MACIYCGSEDEFAFINLYPKQHICVVDWLCLIVDGEAMVEYAAYRDTEPSTPLTYSDWLELRRRDSLATTPVRRSS